MKKLSILIVILLFVIGFSFAQEQYGNIRGVVVDEEGTLLPGITVTLESEKYAPRSVITSEGGVFRFINVSLGKWRVKCEFPGFKTFIQKNIDIRVGVNIDLRIVLESATLEEEITVVDEAPIVDTKKTGTAINVTQVMLQEIPSARDPWVILQRVPGIVVSEENIGGSRSGQQSGYLSKGLENAYTSMWNMDGVPITDMVAVGFSPTYFDFDQLEEIQIVTSGQDASIQTGGVSINFITKRGTNKLQVTGRAFFTNDDLQGENRTEELKELGYVGDQINQIWDYGLQLGGPIKKDKLWFWIGHGIQDIRHITINGYPDNKKLVGFNAKLNYRISSNNRAELAFVYNDKISKGKYAGPSRPPETTLDLWGNGSPYFKLEDEHYFSDNFLLSLKLAALILKFGFNPRGGMDVQSGYDYSTGVWSGSFYQTRSERPLYSAEIDGNYFLENFLGGNHEFKFGIGYRLTPCLEYSRWPGDVSKYYWNGAPLYASVKREGNNKFKKERYSFYLTDAFSRGRLTLNLGFRMDWQKSIIKESSVEASQAAPDFLTAMTYPALDPKRPYLTLSPRLGFTFDLTGDGKTVLCFNIARYGRLMSAGQATFISPAASVSALYFWNDLNGDDRVTTDELVGYPTDGLLSFYGFDPSDPTKLESPNEIDKNLNSALTDELLLGLEREIFTDFSLSLNLTLRRNHRFMWSPLYDKETGTKITQEDYTGPISGSLTYDGKTYAYEYWTLSQYRPPGRYKENRPDYHENYTGIEIIARKRLSHRWMMDASFTYQIHNAHYGEKGYNDPTNIDKWDGARVTSYPDWMAKLSFLYQLPWGFNVSCFAHARQGFILWRYIRVRTPERGAVGLGGMSYMDIEKYGTTRLPDFYNMDLSLVKEICFGNYGMLSLSIDAFNVFNSSHTLWRVGQVNSPRYNEITEILNPRVIRFGIRYKF